MRDRRLLTIDEREVFARAGEIAAEIGSRFGSH
jgi:hypothetical protein